MYNLLRVFSPIVREQVSIKGLPLHRDASEKEFGLVLRRSVQDAALRRLTRKPTPSSKYRESVSH